MKLVDIAKKTDQELADLLRTEREALASAVVDSRTKEVHNVKVITSHKKTIARALTIARERTIAKQEASQ